MKPTFSFAKAERFKGHRRMQCKSGFYDLPSAFGNRAPNFGFGKRYDFTELIPYSPAPNRYNLKSTFDPSSLQRVNSEAEIPVKSCRMRRKSLVIKGDYLATASKPILLNTYSKVSSDTQLRQKLSYLCLLYTSPSPRDS